jgi:glycosyltransferase involved in cell wall biosynthesis
MKISIVTVSFNQGRFLEQAIQSVVSQDHYNVEYIVVDPGSQDQSRDIIRGYQDQIDHIVFEDDNGPSEGLNHGFSHATGQVFGFLNADDVLLPGALRTVATFFERHRAVDVVAAHGCLIDSHGNVIRRKHSHRFSAWRYLYRGAHLLQQSTFFRADAFRKVGGFNEANRTCWDGELWLDMALAGCRFHTLNSYLSLFRTYNESITGMIASNAEARRLYEWDRNRMFRQATGRDPNGFQYQFLRGSAQFLKWMTNPGALKTSLFVAASSKLRRTAKARP